MQGRTSHHQGPFRHVLKPAPSPLLAALLILATAMSSATADMRGARIQLEPPRLALLARHVESLGSAAVWDFASITLDALLDSYREELEDAAREPASTPERRAKLARWRRATADLATRIQSARLRLLDGATASVYTDPQHQVLIVVDGRPIAVSGPRLEADRVIEDRVVERFCAYNDCSPLAASPTPPPLTRTGTAGSWVLGQDLPPTFEIDGTLRCEFTSMVDRDRKGRACRRTADQALQLAAALQEAQRRGHRVDWEWLMHNRPSRAADGQVVVNPQGAYLPLPSHMLTRIHVDDWPSLVRWLRAPEGAGQEIAVLRHADDLLD